MDENLFPGLREAARKGQDDVEDPRWLALVHGELTDEDIDDLAAEGETSEETARRLAAYQPLDRTFRDRAVAEIHAVQDGDVRAFPRDRARSKRPRGAGLGGLPLRLMMLAATALLAIGLMWQLSQPFGGPLPAYELVAVEGAQRASRGTVQAPADSAAEALAFSRDGRIRLALAPFESLGADDVVAVDLYVESGGGLLRVDDAVVAIGELGGVEITGEVDEILGTDPGARRLVLVLGRSKSLPSMRVLRAALAGDAESEDSSWQLFVQEVEVLSDR